MPLWFDLRKAFRGLKETDADLEVKYGIHV